MSLYIIAVGRIKNNSLREACAAYAKRVSRHVKLEIIEVRDSGHSDKHAAAARDEETKHLMRAVPAGARIVVLTRAGLAESSSQFAKRLGDWRDNGVDVAFVVGGAHGIADELIERAQWRMSISKMTLPHELARLVLLEQIYRACTIWRGEPYHKGG